MVGSYEKLCEKSIGGQPRSFILQWKVDAAFLSFYLHDTLHLMATIPNIQILLKNGRYLLMYEQGYSPANAEAWWRRGCRQAALQKKFSDLLFLVI
jgi:hypothetical protein